MLAGQHVWFRAPRTLLGPILQKFRSRAALRLYRPFYRKPMRLTLSTALLLFLASLSYGDCELRPRPMELIVPTVERSDGVDAVDSVYTERVVGELRTIALALPFVLQYESGWFLVAGNVPFPSELADSIDRYYARKTAGVDGREMQSQPTDESALELEAVSDLLQVFTQ